MGDLKRTGQANGLPPELSELLSALNDGAREEAWSRLIGAYNRLIMHAVNGCSDSYDGAMERYTFVLEGLRDHDFRRLRRYAEDHRGHFATWLVVVTRRLSEDYRRKRYGRERLSVGGNGDVLKDRHATRARLVDLVAIELNPALTPDPSGNSPETVLRRKELRGALESAVGQLESRDQLLLKLRFQDGLPAREIANLLSFPTPFHVYRRLNARLKEIRAVLQAQGFSDSKP